MVEASRDVFMAAFFIFSSSFCFPFLLDLLAFAPVASQAFVRDSAGFAASHFLTLDASVSSSLSAAFPPVHNFLYVVVPTP